MRGGDGNDGGALNSSNESDGVMIRAMRQIINYKENANKKLIIQVSYLQIYCEIISDLLVPGIRVCVYKYPNIFLLRIVYNAGSII